MTLQTEADLRICDIDGCGYPVKARNYCGVHYSRWYKYGDPLETIREPNRPRKPPEHFVQKYTELKECEVKGCGPSRNITKGLCPTHYSRMRTNGDLGGKINKVGNTRRSLPPDERFEAYAVSGATEDDCWDWGGSVQKRRSTASPYGVMTIEGKRVFAHRYSYMKYNNVTLTPAEPVHHTCSNTLCVNPKHLQVVTQIENTAESLERKYYKDIIAELEARIKELEGIQDDKECATDGGEQDHKDT